ncbi:MAG: TRAM domain-containing protein [Candidatus Woesearchaeota archaeon]
MGMQTPPVKVGDELDVTIEAVGEKGDGLAKKNGFVLFIPGVKEGQRVRVRVTKVLRKVGFAEVIGEGGTAVAPAEEAPAESESFGEVPAEAPAEEAPSEEAPAELAEDSESFGEEETAETLNKQ